MVYVFVLKIEPPDAAKAPSPPPPKPPPKPPVVKGPEFHTDVLMLMTEAQTVTDLNNVKVELPLEELSI